MNWNNKTVILAMIFCLSLVGCGGGGGGGGGGGENNTPSPVNSAVSGTVLDVSGAPINSAQVTISSTPITLLTDADGKFSAEVEIGNHTIVIKVGASTVYNSTFTCNEATCNLGSIAAEHCAFSGWRKHLANPIFSSSAAGAWDDPLMGGVSVLKDEEEPVNKYKMWYGGGIVPFGEGMSIGYATSPNGINWTPHQNNPVLTHGNSWDVNGFSGIHVIKDGSTYKLWYEGIDNNGVNHIGYATSPDGINWTPHQGNPVFSPGTNGAWDDEDVGAPWVIKEGATYKMWYWGDDQSTDKDQVGLATSPDGITWQRSGSNPVVSPDAAIPWENGEGIGAPKVIKIASDYTMAYHAADLSGSLRIGMATSIDGIVWNKGGNNPIIDKGTGSAWDSLGVGPSSLIDDSISLKLWHFGIDSSEKLKVGLAVSCK